MFTLWQVKSHERVEGRRGETKCIVIRRRRREGCAPIHRTWVRLLDGVGSGIKHHAALR